ncbi:MAG: tagaturonate reductase, partial [Bacteroidota bacterium]
IVPGFPKEYAPGIWDDIGVKDELLVEGELFHLWVIEGPESLKERLPFFQTNLNVILTNNLKEFRERKVRILNGLHTAFMPFDYLMGLRTVKESVENERILRFHTCALNEEILPTLEGDPDELKAYSDEILRRFKNPAIRHELISISLNSFSKFKTRVLPSIIELHHVEGKLAKHLLFSLAALICFYRGSWNDFPIELSDDPYVLEKLTELWKTKSIAEIVSELLSDKSIWDHDLTQIPGLKERVTLNLSSIVARGVSQALNDLLD